jgi:hypothetical protein
MTNTALFDVSQFGTFPCTREQGGEARVRLDQLIGTRNDVDLTIDFAGVTAMTFSFADEFVGKFIAALDADARRITVKAVGLNDENLEAVSVSLERRKLQLAILHADGNLTLVGDELSQETFAVLGSDGVKSGDVAGILGTTAQNANNRLKKLVEAGAARKERIKDATRGGKEFIYVRVGTDVPEDSGLTSV